MNKQYFPNFNPDRTLFSGQSFAWEKKNDSYYGKLENSIIKIEYSDNHLYWQTYPRKDDFELIEKYFLISEDQYSIVKEIKDQHLEIAVPKYKGLRLLNQNFPQTLLSFTLATNKQIKSIKKSIHFLSEKQSKYLDIDSFRFYFFPSAEFIYNAPESLLKESGIGYRSTYIRNSAEFILNNQENKVTKESLMSIKGVGDKVSDCVLTFSLGVKNRTPIDVWVDRIYENLYKNKKTSNYGTKQAFFQDLFGNNTALAGQYLFEYIRNFKPEQYYEI